MGQLKQWREQQWVRIGTDGSIKGPCGTSKDKKNPDRCLPKAKAQSLSKAERAKTARKKKAAGRKGKTVVANTKKARVSMKDGGEVRRIARGCGKVMSNRRKKTKKPFARLIQILTVGEQRSKYGGKPKQAEIFRRGKDAIRRKHGRIK